VKTPREDSEDVTDDIGELVEEFVGALLEEFVGALSALSALKAVESVESDMMLCTHANTDKVSREIGI
jgi:hypothetical protein